MHLLFNVILCKDKWILCWILPFEFYIVQYHFQRNICYYFYLWACLCVCVHVCTLYGNLRKAEESIGSFGTGVVGRYEMPMWSLGTKLRSTERPASPLTHGATLQLQHKSYTQAKKHWNFTPKQRNITIVISHFYAHLYLAFLIEQWKYYNNSSNSFWDRVSRSPAWSQIYFIASPLKCWP